MYRIRNAIISTHLFYKEMSNSQPNIGVHNARRRNITTLPKMANVLYANINVRIGLFQELVRLVACQPIVVSVTFVHLQNTPECDHVVMIPLPIIVQDVT